MDELELLQAGCDSWHELCKAYLKEFKRKDNIIKKHKEALDWCLTQFRCMPIEDIYTPYGLKEFQKMFKKVEEIFMSE